VHIVQLEDHFAFHIIRQEAEDILRLLGVQSVHDVGDIRRVEILEDVQQQKIRSRPYEVFDVQHQLVIDLDQFTRVRAGLSRFTVGTHPRLGQCVRMFGLFGHEGNEAAKDF